MQETSGLKMVVKFTWFGHLKGFQVGGGGAGTTPPMRGTIFEEYSSSGTLHLVCSSVTKIFYTLN